MTSIRPSTWRSNFGAKEWKWRSNAAPPVSGVPAPKPGERLARVATRVAAAASVAILLSLSVGWAVSIRSGVVGASRTFLHALAAGFLASLLIPPKPRSRAAALGLAMIVWMATLALVAGIQSVEAESGSSRWYTYTPFEEMTWWTLLPVALIYWAAARLRTQTRPVASAAFHAPRSRGDRLAAAIWWGISVVACVYLPIVLVLHLLEYGYGWRLPPDETLRAVGGLVGIAALAVFALAIRGLLPGTKR